MIELRVLTAEDWPVWRELRLTALAEAPYAFGSRLADWQGEGDREQRWRDRLALAGSHNLVATLDGEPVGMATGLPVVSDGTVELISMWVSPGGRGRGVGDRLIGALLAWARDAGAHTFRLRVIEGNEPAIALYRRHGFRASGEAVLDGGARELVMDHPLTTDHDQDDSVDPS